MEYLGNLILVGVYFMIESKYDEQIRAECGTWSAEAIKRGNNLMHSIWQNLGRFVFICAIIWSQPMNTQIIALATFLMYSFFYWAGFDTVFAIGVLKQKPWYLGDTSRIDRWFPKWTHLWIWLLKWAAFGVCVWWVLEIA